MTDFHAGAQAVPIESVDQLVAQFHGAGKPRERWRIGTEYEKVAVERATGRAAPFSGPHGIEAVLRGLAERYGWEPKEEDGRVVALVREGASITLEPGAQLELSGEQCPTIHCTQAELATHVREVVSVGGELGIAFLGLGMQPMSPLDEIEWVPKQRYRIMGPYMTRVGTLDDWNLHLTTLFPEVRLKGYIEIRSADSQPPERMLALPALVKGVFYTQDCLEAGWDLVKRWSFEERVALWGDVHREALLARFKGVKVIELARELYAIAEEGLRRQQGLDRDGRDERVYLQRMGEQLAMGRSPARVIAEKWNGEWDRRVERLIAFAEYRG